MFEKARSHMDGAFNFLDSLDCYIDKQSWMQKEIEDFQSNSERLIAALVSQNIQESLTYEAPFVRIIYVLSGSLELRIDGKTFYYSAGCLIIANAWTRIIFRQFSDTSDPAEVITFLFKKEYFSDADLNQMAEDSLIYRFFLENVKSSTEKSSFFVFQFEPHQDIQLFAMLLLKQTVKMQYKLNRITKSAFHLLITEINSNYEEALQLKDSNLSAGLLIYEILADIEKHYSDISLSDLAQKYYFHPNYLSSLIKEETGKTFSELLLSSRLRHACIYLAQTNMQVQEIIEEIGYSDKTYFYSLFKKQYGITPKEYRKKYQPAP